MRDKATVGCVNGASMIMWGQKNQGLQLLELELLCCFARLFSDSPITLIHAVNSMLVVVSSRCNFQ